MKESKIRGDSADTGGIGEIVDFLQKTEIRRFLVTTHVNPDGDCLASVLLMHRLLQFVGKKCTIFIDDPVPFKFEFLPDFQIVHTNTLPDQSEDCEGVIVLDASMPERTGSVSERVLGFPVIVNIDHHAGNRGFGTFNWVEGHRSSTVEMVFQLYEALGGFLDEEIATLVYTGLVSDTGCFQFNNTTPSVLRLAARMVESGLNPARIYEWIFRRQSLDTLKLLGIVLDRANTFLEGRVIASHLLLEDFERFPEGDPEGFVNQLMGVKDAGLFFLVKESGGDCFRVSLRSNSHVEVGLIAAEMGGGGHAKAAGCTVRGSLHAVYDTVLNHIESRLSSA